VAVTVDGGSCGQNTVIDQDKPAGSQVKKGMAVILYV
jgi:beta-lactam-binding protein with PASTA domain